MIADLMVEHLMDKFAQYLIFKKVKQMIVPFITTELFGITLGTCEYLNIQRDSPNFTFDEEAETSEPLQAEVDRCTGGDYMKKNIRYLEEESNEMVITPKELSVTTTRTGNGANRMRKAVNKMSLALMTPSDKKK